MLNRLQKVPYRINTEILDIANFCMEHRISVGKFRAEEPTPPPPKPDPWETASDEDKVAYRRARTEIKTTTLLWRRRTIERLSVCLLRTNTKMTRSWIPWSFDFRGRVYPIPTSLSPQGTDFDKSLVYFFEEGPVNDWWLGFQVATTWGLDKAPMEDRINWAKE